MLKLSLPSRPGLQNIRYQLVVLDPVMVASSGDRLISQDAEQALRELVAQADVITPNIAELAGAL